MTEEEKQKELIEMMEFFEAIDSLIEGANLVNTTEFAELTPDLWDDFQQLSDVFALIMRTLKGELSKIGPKLIDNDALNAHIQAVILAP